jgi:hypothetical protein
MRLPESTHNRFYYFLENYLRLEYILYLFWALFWLNGLDKFFNGTVVQTPSGPKEFGWFGVTRDQKFIDYFAKLYLPKWTALSFLYTFAVLEIIVGLTFLLILLWRKMPSVYRRLVFKASMLIFLIFSVGDILFGDRQELWEHGTFMVLTLLTYQMYIGRAQERAEIVAPQLDRFDTNRNRRLDTAEYNDFIRTYLQSRDDPTKRG